MWRPAPEGRRARGVGSLQARELRGWIEPAWRWFGSTIVGMGLPFILWDLTALVGSGNLSSLPVCVIIGSVLVGALQSLLLRKQVRRALWWIPACVVGWCLPVAAIALGDTGVLSGAGGVLSAGAIFLGGVVLGVVTGKSWVS